MTSKYQFTSFWEEFYDRHWEKAPGFFGNLFEPELISADELFDIVVTMQQSGFMVNDRFWISGTRTPVSKKDFSFLPLDTYHPAHQDQSFGGYFTRMKEVLGDLPIGINIHRLEKSSPKLWFQLREFVHGLNRLAGGLPTGRWDIDTFFGNYETTPLGIHKDNTSVFAIGVLGKRTYYTWPEEYFQPGDPALSTLDPSILDAHLHNAISMELEPGGVVYWPSSNWHLIKSDGKPSVVVQISAILGKKLSEVIGNNVQRLIETQLGDSDYCKAYSFNATPGAPPKQLFDAHNVLVDTVRNGFVAGALQQVWLMYSTAEGLYPVPPDTTPEEVNPDDEYFIDPAYPVAWQQSGNQTLTIVANGLSFTITATDLPKIVSLLETLNSGQGFTLGKLLERHTEEEIPGGVIRNIILSLKSCRAFQACKDK